MSDLRLHPSDFVLQHISSMITRLQYPEASRDLAPMVNRFRLFVPPAPRTRQTQMRLETYLSYATNRYNFDASCCLETSAQLPALDSPATYSNQIKIRLDSL